MLGYSSGEAAKKLGIDLRTLQRYLVARKISAPKVERVGGIQVRVWSARDIEKVRKILPKIANGRKTRYQKKRAKKKGSKKTSKKK